MLTSCESEDADIKLFNVTVQEAVSSAALQWTIMTLLCLYFLTFVDEFRRVVVRPDVKVTEVLHGVSV